MTVDTDSVAILNKAIEQAQAERGIILGRIRAHEQVVAGLHAQTEQAQLYSSQLALELGNQSMVLKGLNDAVNVLTDVDVVEFLEYKVEVEAVRAAEAEAIAEVEAANVIADAEAAAEIEEEPTIDPEPEVVEEEIPVEETVEEEPTVESEPEVIEEEILVEETIETVYIGEEGE